MRATAYQRMHLSNELNLSLRGYVHYKFLAANEWFPGCLITGSPADTVLRIQVLGRKSKKRFKLGIRSIGFPASSPGRGAEGAAIYKELIHPTESGQRLRGSGVFASPVQGS
jgi:hypothetical protein